jgi:hypothetical protein
MIYILIEQTIQDAVRHLQLIFIYHPKTLLTSTVGFSFLSCILYTKVVNIMSLSGTHHKKEPFSHKGSHKATISTLCSFLYILGVTRFLLAMKVRKVYKKPTFYTYAWPVNYSLYSRKYVIICSMIFLPYENKYQNKKLPLLTTRGSFLFSFLKDYFTFLYLRSYF